MLPDCCKRAYLLALVFAGVAVWSCSAPPAMEYYVPTEKCGVAGSYDFTVEMSDTLLYSFDILVNMGCDKRRYEEFSGIPLHIVFKEADGTSYTEDVTGGPQCRIESTKYSQILQIPYRYNCEPKISGAWNVSIFADSAVVEEFDVSGIGLRVRSGKDRVELPKN